MKFFKRAKDRHTETAAMIFISIGGKPPASKSKGKWALASFLAWVWLSGLFFSWPVCWVWLQLRAAWVNRKDIWVHLDKVKVLQRQNWWKRLNTARRKRLIDKCNKSGHTLQGTLLENGQPGKMCQTCKYIQQITPREFKSLFHISVNQAIKRAKDAGRQVVNADKYLAIH
jgi:hypothetical protein